MPLEDEEVKGEMDLLMCQGSLFGVRIECIHMNNEKNYLMTFDLTFLASSKTLQKKPSCFLIAHSILNGVIFC